MNTKLFKYVLSFLLIILFVFIYKKTIRKEYYFLKKPLEIGNLSDLGFIFSPSSKVVEFYSGSLKIVADLFVNEENSPSIIILHGSSTKGRKLELNQILAQKFFDVGYTVIAIDLRGYGDSDDPQSLKNSKDFDFAQDIISTLDYLFANVKIDTASTFIVGHSFGAGVALKPIVEDYRIKKAVLFGPPRRYSERFWGNDTLDRQSIIDRKIRDMKLDYDLHFDVYKDVIKNQDIDFFISKLNSSRKPIFLIDCGKEDRKDLLFLERIHDSLTVQKEYWTIPSVDHYLNTGSFFTMPAYNTTLINKFIARVDNWLKK